VEADLGLLEGPGQHIEGGHRGQVEQRPDRSGDRYPSMRRYVCGGQPLTVDEDPVAPEVPGGRRDGHLSHGSASQHAPQRTGRGMAEHGAVPQREHARVPPRRSLRRQLAQREHTGVARNQPAGLAAGLDLVAGQPQRAQLGEGDVAVLARGEAGDATNVISTPHTGIEVTFVGGSPP